MIGRTVTRLPETEETHCECGVALDVHPPLPAPKPWGHGRPCAKTALDRGIGWDGRPLPEHGAGVIARWRTHPVMTEGSV